MRFAAIFLIVAALEAQPVCQSCHPAIAQSYSKTAMARSFSVAKPESGAYFHRPSEIYYQNLTRDGRYVQRQYQLDANGKAINSRDTQIDYALGSGAHARSFLHRTARNTLILLPLGWYAENGGTWAMNPGYDRPDHQALRREITYDCMFCHNAYPQIPADHAAPVYAALPEGIDCQRCHGDGGRHAALAKSGSSMETIRAAIVNPARLTADRSMEVCMQCHLETTSASLPSSIVRYERGPFSYHPGEPLADFRLDFDHAPGSGHDDKFEITGSVYRLRKSQCFEKSNGALQCTTCHDPHSATPRNITQVCRGCHAAKLDRLVAANRHTPAEDCASCHMPKRRTDDVVHVVMTDHYIQRIRPATDLLAPKPEWKQTDYRGEVIPYNLPSPKPADELYVSIAQVIQGANLAAGIPRLAAAIDKFRPEHSEYYVQLADALSSAQAFDRALPVYEIALRHAPDSEAVMLRLARCLTSLGQYTRAEATLGQALKIAPGDAAAWIQLGLVQLAENRTSGALASFEKATVVSPDMVEPYNLLGAMLFETGDARRAETILREAIRIQPNFAPAHNNLGNLLSETDRFEEAKLHFEAALRYQDNYIGARYNYALALNRVHRLDDAQSQIEALLRITPGSAEAREFLGNILTAKGQLDRAIAQYREALRIQPEFDRANLDLGSALTNSGKPSEALPYLNKAARSPSAEIRRAAKTFLDKLAAPR